MPQAAAYRAATCLIVSLIEEIILIVRSCEVVLSPGLASEGLAVTDFLQIVQTAGDDSASQGGQEYMVRGD